MKEKAVTEGAGKNGAKKNGAKKNGAGAGKSKTGQNGMERVNRIWNHPRYQECLDRIRVHEETREFCRHTPEHFLDVARLTYILAGEAGRLPEEAEGRNKVRERIYAAALLHDIGRHLQYEQGIPHEKASGEIAEGILRDCGFEKEEREKILRLIGSHRRKQEGDRLEALFYRADKLSRNCFACPSCGACDWPADEKNLEIRL